MYGAIKRIICGFLLAVMAVFSPICGMTAFAAEKIDTVKVIFSCGETPKAGEAVGTVNARTTSREFTVDSAEYINGQSTWELGDRPEVKVSLSAAEGYRFTYTSKSRFKLSGCGAEFSRSKVEDNGVSLTLEVKFKQVEGTVDPPDGLEWDGSYALWSQVDDAKEYEVRLYRDKKQTATVNTRDTAYDFRDKITRGGDYTFRVRSISRFDRKAGQWSDYSDSNTFTDGGAIDGLRGGWIQNQTGWWYRYNNGDYPTDCWKNINHEWYYFNGDGYMLNGWQQIDGHWYYLSGSGSMLTGWQFMNGKWYYLDESGAMLTDWRYLNGRWYYLDGSGAMLTGWQFVNGNWYYLDGTGAMLTGWQHINGWWRYLEPYGAMAVGWKNLDGKWYYLDRNGVMLTGWQYINGHWYYLDAQGVMYAGRMTPDGYYVGADGVWAG